MHREVEIYFWGCLWRWFQDRVGYNARLEVCIISLLVELSVTFWQAT